MAFNKDLLGGSDTFQGLSGTLGGISPAPFIQYRPPTYGRVTVSEGALSLILGWLLEKEKPEQVQRAIDALNNELFYRK